jgi:hypothetical protein
MLIALASAGYLCGKCRLPGNRAASPANAGCAVTMLIVSMDVPLVLCSTAIDCGLRFGRDDRLILYERAVSERYRQRRP